jgi:hypothetical protein
VSFRRSAGGRFRSILVPGLVRDESSYLQISQEVVHPSSSFRVISTGRKTPQLPQMQENPKNAGMIDRKGWRGAGGAGRAGTFWLSVLIQPLSIHLTTFDFARSTPTSYPYPI